MSVRYTPVGWNRNKLIYDAVLAASVTGYILLYLRVAPAMQNLTRPIDGPTLRMQAFGSAAFLMLSTVLAIGPLARLDRRFLPLLYNRRHFGVLTFMVALTHASQVLGWYFAFGVADPYVALLAANTSYGQWHGFPFELFGILALVILAMLATTSHDFWLSFLTPPVWKTMHMAVYLAYAAVILHVALGRLQDGNNPLLAVVVASSALILMSLHVVAGRREQRHDRAAAPAVDPAPWVDAGSVDSLAEGRGLVVAMAGAERVAVFRHRGKLSAVSNLCAHQNGPLGEGKVIGGCITCPWHGFQYRLADGCAPPPYTEKLATYHLKLAGRRILVDPRPEPARDPCRARPDSGYLTMADPTARDAFFVGYGKKVPRRLALFLAGAGAATIGGFAAAGLALGLAVDDPGDGGYAFDLGPQKLTGVVELRPYPVLRLRPDAAHPEPRTIMVSGGGKHGVQAVAASLDGQMVEATGVLLKRGTIAMLQLDGDAPMRKLTKPVPFQPAASRTLGRWRLAGEICDGKCYTGAMRPGRGLSHKACANLCLTGGIPAVFVSTGPVDGSSFFLLAGEEGGPLPDAGRNLVAASIELEGRVDRLDDLLVLRADLDRARLL